MAMTVLWGNSSVTSTMGVWGGGLEPQKSCEQFNINTLPAKDGDLRLSPPNACLPKTEISVFVTECVFFYIHMLQTTYMFTLHDVLYS